MAFQPIVDATGVLYGYEALMRSREQGGASSRDRSCSNYSPQDWRRTLKAMAVMGPTRIGHFSFRNIVILLTQGLSGRYAATLNTWRQLGQRVRRGEKGFVVLRPRIVRAKESDCGEERKLVGFSYLPVFALAQTDGPELTLVEPRDFVGPENFLHTAQALREVARMLPNVSGIEVRERGQGTHGPTRGSTVRRSPSWC